VDKWNVDIISMSFAFEEPDSGILKAINHAVDCGVLLFAAASNNRAGRRNPIGYPAREVNVICVNSTDDQGNKSTFSPEGVERDYNFAILGENLEAAWQPTPNNGQNLKRVTGTSQATPLVAGIAAIILHVTRMKQFGRFEMERLLKQARGMSKVLYECMTKKQGAPRYNYITPGDLLNSKLSSIRVKIETALENL
jgi:subtilisin family serine protease